MVCCQWHCRNRHTFTVLSDRLRALDNSGSKANSNKYKAKDMIFTHYCKRQHLLLKQSTIIHYGNADAMVNVSRCILKNV